MSPCVQDGLGTRVWHCLWYYQKQSIEQNIKFHYNFQGGVIAFYWWLTINDLETEMEMSESF